MPALDHRIITVGIMTALCSTAARAQGPANTLPIDNVIREQVTGEPYQM